MSTIHAFVPNSPSAAVAPTEGEGDDASSRGRLPRRPRRTVKVLLALAAAAASVLVAAPAMADHGIYTTATVNIRSGPSTAYSILGSVPSGVSPTYLCWTQGQNINGVDVWFKMTYGSVTGYISSYYDNSSYSTDSAITSKYGIPQCGSSSPAPSGTYVTTGTAVRYCVNTGLSGCNVLGPTIGANSSVAMQCWKDSSGQRWFYVRAGSGVVGFVPSGVVANQTSVGWCPNDKRVTASEAAATRQGQVWASSADQAYFGASEWSPGPVGEWSGDCPKLPYVAWKAAGMTIVKGDAINNYSYYRNAGLIHTDGNPPAGAVVFFNITSHGHEATSLGNGMLATTRGIDGNQYSNAIVPLSSYSYYLGYYLPA